jgi:hypothetical protein
MEPLGINDNPSASKLIMEEFIDGRKGESNRTKEEQVIMNDTLRKLSENYAWNEKSYFSQMAGQNCSDMLLHIGELIVYKTVEES